MQPRYQLSTLGLFQRKTFLEKKTVIAKLGDSQLVFLQNTKLNDPKVEYKCVISSPLLAGKAAVEQAKDTKSTH